MRDDELFEKARAEIGDDEYYSRLQYVFGKKCLNYVDTIVINLPCPCYAGCDYCFDKQLRKSAIGVNRFFALCSYVFDQFQEIKHISITGGSLPAKEFNYLVKVIKNTYSDCKITWNTNGAGIDNSYREGIANINHINLHRNAVYDDDNCKLFKATKPIISINDAKNLFGKSLCIRVTVDENFILEDYAELGLPLYLNRMLPGTEKTDRLFHDVLDKLNISESHDIRRRNVYLSANYKNIPVRVCLGDRLANHVPNRKPIFLNVIIIHRSGAVCGSWYEDDKLLFKI